MIHYALRCSNGHTFDGWFRSSADFEAQIERSLVACPHCGDTAVTRALMAPAVRTQKAIAPAEPAPADPAPSDAAAGETPPKPVPEKPVAPPTHAALSGNDRAKFIAAVKALREAVVSHGTDVGKEFPEEARRIHYGEAEPRGIYGQANREEAEALVEEGIGILPIPNLPEENN
ncbi:MAG: DUF1178 family protein [Pseudomonadota bacterium]